MTIERHGWLEVFAFEQEVLGWKGEDEERVLMVDFGGGRGHQCVRLRKKYPGLKGRVVLQDLEAVVAGLGSMEGVEIMAHNFLQLQPVKGQFSLHLFWNVLQLLTEFLCVGAKFYYLRAVMHGYPDDKCVNILKNMIPAMNKESKILLDDKVLPDRGVGWQTCELDLVMMSCLGALERTNSQWTKLVESAGLRIEKVYLYSSLMNHSVIVVGLRD